MNVCVCVCVNFCKYKFEAQVNEQSVRCPIFLLHALYASTHDWSHHLKKAHRRACSSTVPLGLRVSVRCSNSAGINKNKSSSLLCSLTHSLSPAWCLDVVKGRGHINSYNSAGMNTNRGSFTPSHPPSLPHSLPHLHGVLMQSKGMDTLTVVIVQE